MKIELYIDGEYPRDYFVKQVRKLVANTKQYLVCSWKGHDEYTDIWYDTWQKPFGRTYYWACRRCDLSKTRELDPQEYVKDGKTVGARLE